MSKAVLCGITGLIGSSLAPQLTKYFDKVTATVRREHLSNNEKIEIIKCDYPQLKHHPEIFRNASSVFYCLGTTQKRAGSSAKFREIEWQLANQVIDECFNHQVPQLVLLSSKGANAQSLFPYFKVKGDIERLARSKNFPSLIIARPSLLMGERSESRLLEGLSIRALAPIIKPLQKYCPSQAPIRDFELAFALAKASQIYRKGTKVLENSDLINLNRETPLLA